MTQYQATRSDKPCGYCGQADDAVYMTGADRSGWAAHFNEMDCIAALGRAINKLKKSVKVDGVGR